MENEVTAENVCKRFAMLSIIKPKKPIDFITDVSDLRRAYFIKWFLVSICRH